MSPRLIDHLWFKDGLINAQAPGFDADAEASALLDSRDDYSVTFKESGETICGRLKYTAAYLGVMLREHEALIRIRWFVAGRTETSMEEGGGEIGFHTVPYSDLLLKPCPSLSWILDLNAPRRKPFVELIRVENAHAEMGRLARSAIAIGPKPT